MIIQEYNVLMKKSFREPKQNSNRKQIFRLFFVFLVLTIIIVVTYFINCIIFVNTKMISFQFKSFIYRKGGLIGQEELKKN